MKPVRIRFEKTGDGKFISHLDLNRTMIFALRRAKLPVWYTEGFNPHPYITFALALPVGVESTCEIMDFRLTADAFPVEEIPARLNACLPESLRVLEAYESGAKPSGIAFARYAVELALCEPGVLERFFALEQIPVEKPLSKKRRKGGGPESERIDLREKLVDPEIRPDGFEVTLPCGETGSIAPKLVLSALEEYAGTATVPRRILRTALLDAALRDFR